MVFIIEILQGAVALVKRKLQPKKYISLYLTSLRDVCVELKGDDLKKMGIPPGPRYKKILAELLDAKLDGLVRNREEEMKFVKNRA